MEFRQFIETAEHVMKDVRKTLKKIPKQHSALLKKWKYSFEDGNGLKGDVEHIGYMDRVNKKINIASPWNYGRQYAFLHEIGHIVWENLITNELKEEWKKIVKNTKEPKQNQSLEELFCMAYANTYAKNKIVIHDHEEWDKFIRKLP